MSRPSQPLRILLAIALIVGAAMLLLTLLRATDTALSVWQRLQDWPDWVGLAVLVLGLVLLLVTAWALWRLLRVRPARAPRAAPLDRAALEQRIDRLGERADEAAAARDELLELDRRRQGGQLQVCLFGAISTGKSSLLQALAPEAVAYIDVLGGATTQVSRYRGRLPDGRSLEVADVPGSHEADGAAHLALAEAEAARSHAVVYVVEGDLSRSQARELELLAGFGRPLVLVLNKADRFDDGQRDQLVQRLRDQARAWQAEVVAVSAGHVEEVLREHPDGRRETIERAVPPRIHELHAALQRIADFGVSALEPGREAALLAHVDTQLVQGERRVQLEQSEAAIRRYTRRAVVGALAAVAPGTDLVIQGALATALTRELCRIHGLQARDVDVDGLLDRVGGLLRTGSSITLAVAGNALKAFPGIGTVSGGLVHAVAYGLIFDSLGRALAQTLAATRELDREATLELFRHRLARPSTQRLLDLARLALEERGSRDPDAG